MSAIQKELINKVEKHKKVNPRETKRIKNTKLLELENNNLLEDLSYVELKNNKNQTIRYLTKTNPNQAKKVYKMLSSILKSRDKSLDILEDLEIIDYLEKA